MNLRAGIADAPRWPGCVLVVALLALAPLACAGEPGPQGKAPARPNILVFMAEDMGPRVGAFGDPVALTPNIDALADEGVRFPNTFTTAGVCAPSRAAHIMAMYQTSFGGQHMRVSSYEGAPYSAMPPAGAKAYPELLRRAGYYTFTNQKLDYQFSAVRFNTGPFSIWDYEGPAPGWEGREEGQPFFGLVNFGTTHESRMFAENVEANRQAGRAEVTAPADVEVPPYFPDLPVIRHDIANHYDNIHAMDAEVGDWLRRLERAGLVENTIVIWTTDHGDGLPRSKRELYDSGTRVPLVVRWPERWRVSGYSPGGEDDRLLSFVDIGPSVLAWAGAEIPEFIQGLPVLADAAVRRDYVFAAKDRLDEFPFAERAIRDGRYRYLLNLRPGEPGAKPIAYRDQLASMRALWAYFEAGDMSAQQAFWFQPRPAEEFYDLANDPHEVNNLADDPAMADEIQRMRTALATWRGQYDHWSDVSEAEMAEEFWPAGEQPVTPAPAIVHANGELVIVPPAASPRASLEYRLGDGAWRLYAQPVAVPEDARVSARAIRYGWAESPVVTHEPEE